MKSENPKQENEAALLCKEHVSKPTVLCDISHVDPCALYRCVLITRLRYALKLRAVTRSHCCVFGWIFPVCAF